MSSAGVNETLISLINALSAESHAQDSFVLIRILNTRFDNEYSQPWSKLNLGTLTKYLETDGAFEVKKVGPGKHLVKVAGEGGQAPQQQKIEPQQEESTNDSSASTSTTEELSDKMSSISVSEKTAPKQEAKPQETPKPAPQKPAPSATRAPPPRASSNNSNVYNVDHEIQMMLDILREMITEGNTITYGEVFASDAIQNSIESLSGTLKAAKRRGILHYQAELLMQGFSDKEIITVHRWSVQEE